MATVRVFYSLARVTGGESRPFVVTPDNDGRCASVPDEQLCELAAIYFSIVVQRQPLEARHARRDHVMRQTCLQKVEQRSCVLVSTFKKQMYRRAAKLIPVGHRRNASAPSMLTGIMLYLVQLNTVRLYFDLVIDARAEDEIAISIYIS